MLLIYLSPSSPARDRSFLRSKGSGENASFPVWVWFFLLTFAALVRFWGIGSLSRWPGGDSSLLALSVIQWMDHWQWKPFVILSQVPSTLSYLFYFAARLTGSNLLGIQIPSALVSFLTVVLSYAAARLYFSRPLAGILAVITAFNLWDLLLSRCDEPGVLLPFWEWGVLYLFGRLTLSPNPASRKIWACALGLALGLGPYTFMAWPVLTLFGLGVAGGWFWKKTEWAAGGLFFIFLLGGMVPFLLTAVGTGYGGHLHEVAAWNDPSFTLWGQARVAFSYLQAIFWGGTSGMELAPQGGLLNALLGSAFLLGFVEMVRGRFKLLSKILLVAFPIFLLPGLLSRDLEAHRMLLALPLLLIFLALGIETLVLSLPGRLRPLLLVVVLGSSAVWDLNRLFLPNPAQVDFSEYRDGYRSLDNLARAEGPGWIFSDMVPSPQNYSLAYCSYPFNAAWNQRLGQDVKWAAVFTETHYLPFLSQALPDCRWINGGTPQPGVLSRHALGILPVTPVNRTFLERWKSYYTFQQEINLESVDIPTGKPHQAVLEKMLQAYPSIPSDPFLQSCYFEKLAFNFSWENTFFPGDNWANWNNFSETFHQSFGKSYQDATLCEKYGKLLAVEGEKAEAKKIFQKAQKLSPGNAWLKYEMGQLGLGS